MTEQTTQSKLERIMLYGVVPVAAALLGSLATVWASNYLGHTAPSDAASLVLRDASLSPADKAKLLALLNNDTDKFYDFLGRILSIVSVTVGVLSVTFSYRLYRK
jgi:uncharacterized membrane protein